jgi:predicted transcriptional regulator
MITHLKRCKERKNVTNMARQLKSVVMSPEGVALEKWRFSKEVSRRELTRMITLHSLPLALVDYVGFRRFFPA